MNLIQSKFYEKFSKRFLTENVALFLYSLIKVQRPQSIIEVGCGYTSPFIAEAIKDCQNEIMYDTRACIEEYENYTSNYDPKYFVIDNFEMGEEYSEELNYLNKTGICEFIKCNVEDYIKINQDQTYDLIWLDYGNGEDYIDSFLTFYNLLNLGGTLILHSTETHVYGRLFLREIELMKDRSFEMMTFVEPHKKFQNSFTVFKKVKPYPLYSIYG